MQYIAVYGSLRVGEYNFERLSHSFPNSIKSLGTTEVPNYIMYDLGQYPAISEGEGTIKVDILECNEDAFEAIDIMEFYAGYDSKTVQLTIPETGQSIDCTIYTMNPTLLTRLGVDVVESGDWSEYLRTTEKL